MNASGVKVNKHPGTKYSIIQYNPHFGKFKLGSIPDGGIILAKLSKSKNMSVSELERSEIV